MLVAMLAAGALAAWLGVLLLSSGSWRTRERISPPPDPGTLPSGVDLGRVTVLIPARDEAATIGRTLAGLAGQGRNLEVRVIDDQSRDATASVAAEANAALSEPLDLEVIAGRELPAGWGGKLWALEQGLQRADRELCLLLDAEIELAPGMLGALIDKAESEGHALVSVMAKLRCESFWEKLLVPPFIFFFKLLYPFARVNEPNRRTAAAAGGCLLVRTRVLREIGGFASIRAALIDDCALAARVKRAGHSIWLGLSDAVRSLRAYPDLGSFRRMVTRTAFTQLRYSAAWLVCVIVLMGIVFLAPLLALVIPGTAWGRTAGIGAFGAMAAAFWPTIRFYRLGPGWALTLPVAAVLFLAMTVESAVRFWRGVKAEWKGRTYAAGR